VVMGLLPANEEIVEFIRAGVSGFVLKDATVEQFVDTITAVADGNSVLPPMLTGTLFTHVAAQAVARGKKGAKAAVRMTVREREVVELIAEGLSNKEIAERLHIATHTVKSHVHNILEKLALHSRLQIAAHAHKKQPPKGDRRKFVR
jgi:DNA-binding NarL/FixJ family response regulator